jgi:chlorite dismutase
MLLTTLRINKMSEEKKITRTVADRAKKEVRERKSFNGTQQKLTVSYTIEGKHLHWVNDYPGRVLYAQEVGYEFVSFSEVFPESRFDTERNLPDERVKKLVGRNEDNSPLYAYLMKIDEDWYKENQLDIQQRVDMVDAAIKVGKPINSPVENAYIPKSGISMKHKLE